MTKQYTEHLELILDESDDTIPFKPDYQETLTKLDEHAADVDNALEAVEGTPAALATEVANRAQGDSVLNQALQSETLTRQTQVSELQASNTAEAAARAQGDATTLGSAVAQAATAASSALATEAAARTAADNTLTTAVSGLTAGASTEAATRAAQVAAINAALPNKADLVTVNGVKVLNPSQLPAINLGGNLFPVDSEAEMLALSSAVKGDLARRSDLGGSTFYLNDLPASDLANWQQFSGDFALNSDLDQEVSDRSAGDAAAVATAASDATTKANAAQSAAISAASTDATSKASTAQANAISAAATDATSKAATAQNAAIAAASADASTKATDAQTAAISAAATDATSKASTAQANAISTAATDATTKALAAQTNAIANASSDATAKVATEASVRLTADNLRVLKTSIGAAGSDGVANFDATELKLGQVLPLVINIESEPYGAALDGSTSDSTAISAAIAAASTAGGGRVTAKYGKTAKITSAIVLKSNVHVDLPITIKPSSAVTTAVFVGNSGDTVTNTAINNPFMVIDGDFSVTNTACNGVRISNGTRVSVANVAIQNLGGAGVVFQGTSSGNGTTHSKVSHCDITNVGLSDGATGFGVLVKNASSFCKIENNDLLGIKGGMGIGANDSEGYGFPLHLSICNNTIAMAASNTGFEAIGLTAGCDFATINNNNIYNSQDNGISVSCSYSTAIGNVVDGTLNHGIDSSGTGNVIANNVIRNVGRQDSLDYGGISISSASYNVIMGNRIVESATTGNRTAYGIKGITSAGNNRIIFNIATGYRIGYVSALHATDFVIDDVTNTDGFTFGKAHFGTIYGADSSTALIVGSGFRMNGVNFSGSTTYGTAQLNAQTNLPASRPSFSTVGISGQAADLWQAVFRNTTTNAETVLAKFDISGVLSTPTVKQTGVQSKTATYTALATDSTVLANGTFTVTLPAVALGQQLTIKNTGTGVITVAPASGTIDGAANKTISTQYNSLTLLSDGTNWFIV